MTAEQSTCWSLIDAAAKGSEGHRSAFIQRYRPLLAAYFGARWRTPPLSHEADDAVQEVFLQCIRPAGVLAKADRSRPGGFRAFLYGVARNVALKAESRRRLASLDSERAASIAADDDSLSDVFDRAWAVMILREAAELMRARAPAGDDEALRRIELLRLRFGEGLPIREIAARWNVDPAILHRQYPRARDEFTRALMHVVGDHHPGAPEEIARECERLQDLFQ